MLKRPFRPSLPFPPSLNEQNSVTRSISMTDVWWSMFLPPLLPALCSLTPSAYAPSSSSSSSFSSSYSYPLFLFPFCHYAPLLTVHLGISHPRNQPSLAISWGVPLTPWRFDCFFFFRFGPWISFFGTVARDKTEPNGPKICLQSVHVRTEWEKRTQNTDQEKQTGPSGPHKLSSLPHVPYPHIPSTQPNPLLFHSDSDCDSAEWMINSDSPFVKSV